MTDTEPTTLLPTELELVASFDLGPFVRHFDSRVLVLRDSNDDGVHTLWFDLAMERKTLDEAIGHWVALVEEMPESLRTLWNACTDRCLNTGIHSGQHPHAMHLEIRAATIAALDRISVRLLFSVYALD